MDHNDSSINFEMQTVLGQNEVIYIKILVEGLDDQIEHPLPSKRKDLS